MDTETVTKSAQEATDAVTTAAQQAADTAISMASNWGLQVIGAIALLIVGRWVSSAVGKGVRRSLEAAKVDPALVTFFSGMAHYLALTVVVIAVLSLFGIQTTSLVAIVGAAGLAIGLALQGTLSNFASGVMLLIFRPVRIGDFVEVAGVAGAVAELGIFASVLDTPDNIRITIPNSSIYGAIIKNYSINEKRRIDLVVNVGYGENLGSVTRLLEEIVRKDARVLAEPALDVFVGELGATSVQVVVRPWVLSGDYWPAKAALNRAIKDGLESGGVRVPVPMREIQMVGGPAAD